MQAVYNAVKSLYQVVIYIDGETNACEIVDCDDVFKHVRKKVGSYPELFRTFHRNIHPEDREELEVLRNIDEVHRMLSENVFIKCDCRIRHADSVYHWSRVTLCNTREAESPEGEDYLFLVQDLTCREEAEFKEAEKVRNELYALQSKYDELFMESMTDGLTGCLNRKGLSYYEGIILSEARGGGKELFVSVIDLNGLKYMNDTFGHGAGDEAIRTVGNGLKASAPDCAKIFRTGGDEFLVIAAVGGDGGAAGEAMGKGLQAYLQEYNASHDNPFTVAASYGYVVEAMSEGIEGFDALIEEADQKMYKMKEETDPYKR